ncbi:unnamed protein product [Rangifer tarandus platyrhynchus]|uniref:Uncharacterized protein n=1 Tax=Rangifer tarandus platyrhynchus TaxID=3082113 RepID=A0AC59ZZS1_RANTA
MRQGPFHPRALPFLQPSRSLFHTPPPLPELSEEPGRGAPVCARPAASGEVTTWPRYALAAGPGGRAHAETQAGASAAGSRSSRETPGPGAASCHAGRSVPSSRNRIRLLVPLVGRVETGGGAGRGEGRRLCGTRRGPRGGENGG